MSEEAVLKQVDNALRLLEKLTSEWKADVKNIDPLKM